jgi:LPS sulfotransferase NodH
VNNLIYGDGLQTPPRASYIVCATPRSGSTYLCEALKQTNIAGYPDEYFLHWHRAARTPENLDKYNKRAIAIDRLDYIKGVIERGTRNNVFGIKIMQSYLDLILQEFQRFSPTTFASKAELLQSYFPNLHYIYLSRTDKVRQAVSWAKAVQSGEWEAYYWTPLTRAYKYWISSGSRPVFNFQQIQAFYKTLLDQSEKWEAFFQECAIQPYRIEY